jgi:hypothetical protein
MSGCCSGRVCSWWLPDRPRWLVGHWHVVASVSMWLAAEASVPGSSKFGCMHDCQGMRALLPLPQASAVELWMCACHVLHASAVTAVQWQAAACCNHQWYHVRIFQFAERPACSGEGRGRRLFHTA